MLELLSEARFYFAQCVFNTRCYYAAVDRCIKKRNRRKWIAIAISAVTLILLILHIIFLEKDSSQFWLPILSWIGLFLTAASLTFSYYCSEDLSDTIHIYKQSAEDYKALREQFMDLVRQIKAGGEYEKLSMELQQLLHDYSMIGKYSLVTDTKDYTKAQMSLGLRGQGEAFTWSDEEIDRFLPQALRGLAS
jgi:hypothetical protein